MMDCPECTAARERAWHGLYLTACFGCRARGLARSQCTVEAKRAGQVTPDLRARIEEALPQMPLAEAVALINAWWDHDHPKETEPEGAAA